MYNYYNSKGPGYYCNIMVQSITITIAIFLPPLSIGSLVMISSSPIVNKMQWFVHWWFIVVYRSSHANSISCNDHDRYHVMELRSMNIWTLFMIIWILIFIILYWHSPHLLDIFIPFLTLWSTPFGEWYTSYKQKLAGLYTLYMYNILLVCIPHWTI